MVSKIVKICYFWPTMQVDARELIKKCNKYQRFGNVQCLPTERLTTIASPWPFAQWRIDIVGSLPQGKGQIKFLLVDIDYFTKWVEVKALAIITKARIQSFIWKNIICNFRIPRSIISDNGWQFYSKGFRDSCSSLGIKNQFSSPGHLQANGKTEVTNRTLLKIIKTRLTGLQQEPQQEKPPSHSLMAPRQ